MSVRREHAGELAKQAPSLLRKVLEERFRFSGHAERRPLPVYALMRVSDSGRLGPQGREAVTNCPPVPNDPTSKACWGGSWEAGSIRAGALGMPGLAAGLTTYGGIGRVVVDRTGLDGSFELELRWSPGLTAAAQPGASLLEDLPSLFVALREQLGLKLEAATETMEVLAIDHVELPSPN